MKHKFLGKFGMLIISFHFPPLLSARSIQVAKFVKYLRRLGVDIDIVTLDPQYHLSKTKEDDTLLDKFVDSAIRIERVGGFYFNKHIRRILIFIIGLPYILAIKNAIHKSLELARSKKYDVIYSISMPFESHIVGWFLKKRLKTSKWIAYFSDPFANAPLLFFSSKLRRLLLKKMIEEPIVRNADICIFPSNELREFVLSNYRGKYASKSGVMPHFYDREIVPRRKRRTAKNKVKIVSVGSFSRHRSMDTLLKALFMLKKMHSHVLKKLQIEIIGNVGGFDSLLYDKKMMCELNQIVKVYERTPYLESLAKMASADYLLLFDVPYKDSPLFPSKLADYLGFSIPIIGITGSNSCSAKILRKFSYPIIEPHRPDLFADLLKDIIEAKQVFRPAHYNLRDEYSCETVVQKFIKFLEKCYVN